MRQSPTATAGGAWQVVDELNLVKIWEAAGARVNSVGSLATGLLAKHLDIDFHIYSEPPLLPSGFAAMARIAENASVRRIECVNLLHTDEKCVEWHAWYEDRDGELWQIDMIHIEAGSAYDGYFERFARRLQRALTPEMRQGRSCGSSSRLPTTRKSQEWKSTARSCRAGSGPVPSWSVGERSIR